MSIKAQEPLAVATAALVLKGTSNGSQGTSLRNQAGRRGMQRRLRDRGTQLALELGTKALLARHGALVVRMVRVAPRALDDDNLATAFKRLRDAIAKSTGIHDASERVLYVPDAEPGDEHLVRVEVYEQLVEFEAGARVMVSQDALGDRPVDLLAMPRGLSARLSPNVRRVSK
jgi:hypothetical protein